MVDLSSEIQQQIEQVADQLAGPDKPGESFQAKAGRLMAARQAAEEMVLGEMLAPTPPETPDTDGYPPTDPESPEDLSLDQAMREFSLAREELAEQTDREAMPALPPRPTHLTQE